MNFIGQTTRTPRRQENPADLLTEIEIEPGTTIGVYQNTFTNRRGTKLHTIKLTGLAKNTIFGPQKFIALLGACAQAARYFEENGQIELSDEEKRLLSETEAVFGGELVSDDEYDD